MKYQKDYYQILDVKPNATLEEIKSAYRRLVSEVSPQETARIEAINEAYDVLGDQSQRTEYDFEYFNVTTMLEAKASSSAEMAKLQEFSEKEPIGKFASASTWFMFYLITTTLCLAMTMLFLSRFPPYIPVDQIPWGIYLVPPLAVLGMISLIIFWQSSQADERENQCPQCLKGWAAEKLDEKFMGRFQKSMEGDFGRNRSGRFVRCEKYQLHYKCKYCAYEWLFIKIRKV